MTKCRVYGKGGMERMRTELERKFCKRKKIIRVEIIKIFRYSKDARRLSESNIVLKNCSATGGGKKIKQHSDSCMANYISES